MLYCLSFFFQAEDGIRDYKVTGVQTCALPISKYYLFYVIFAGQCVVFGLSGGLFNVVLDMLGHPPHPQGAINRAPTHAASLHSPVLETSPPVSLRVYHGLLLAAILWLFVGLVLLPLTDAGIFGAQVNAGVVNRMWSLAVG